MFLLTFACKHINSKNKKAVDFESSSAEWSEVNVKQAYLCIITANYKIDPPTLLCKAVWLDHLGYVCTWFLSLSAFAQRN
jgi:hypothetical protein